MKSGHSKGRNPQFFKNRFFGEKILEVNANTIAQTIFFFNRKYFYFRLGNQKSVSRGVLAIKRAYSNISSYGKSGFFFERQVVSLFSYRLWYLTSSPSSVGLVRHQLPEKFRFICVYLCPTTDFVRVRHRRSSNFAIKSVMFLKKPVFAQKGIVGHILVHILMYYNYHYSL